MEIKYPRTYHLPNSPGSTSDDKIQKNIEYLENIDFIVLEKMDGENTSMSKNKVWARSLDSKTHESRHYVYRIWGEIAYKIPENYIICGENLYAKHSIHYQDLEDYFQVFSVWDKNICLSWEATKMFCNDLGLSTVKELGQFSSFPHFYDNFDKFLVDINYDEKTMEGIVIRPKGSFTRIDFENVVLKWVRKNHVTTDEHWMNQEIIKNRKKVCEKN
jgi:hypothetical protein